MVKQFYANIGVELNNYITRTESFEGREHIVAPVVLLLEGVHHGSAGRVLYTTAELERYPEAWSGIPLPIDHPHVGGHPASANTPQLVEGASVGRLWNTYFDNGQLRGEVWIDVAKAADIAPEVLARVQRREPLEVSTGMWFDAEPQQGTFRGENYDLVARNFRPDHLALLPEGVGACSYQDGCGLRANKIEEGEEMDKKRAWEAVTPGALEQLGLNAAGYRKIGSLLQAELDRMDVRNSNSPVMHYLVEFYEDSFIYRVENRDGSKFFKRTYAVENEKKIKLGEEVTEVREERKYVAITSKTKTNEKEDSGMKKCCPEKVAALIANEAWPYTEDDRGWMEALTEEAFGRLEAAFKPPVTNDNGDEEKAQLLKANKDLTTEVGGLKEELKTLKDKQNEKEEPKFEEMLANAAPDVREAIEEGQAMAKRKKEELIKEITANKRNTFTPEELQGKKLPELEKLAQMAREVKYAGGGPNNPQDTEEEALEMPAINWEK
jgi:hypothetical protein